MKRVKVEGMCHQLVKAKLKRIVAKDFQIIYIKKDTLIEIVIKVIAHKRTDMRVKRLFYNMDSVLARAGGIFLQPERRGLGQPEQSEAACRLSQPQANNTTLLTVFIKPPPQKLRRLLKLRKE